ncbi:hypothetical protein D3C73_661460 [compost metagenome]
MQTAQFNVVFRRYDNLQVRVEVQVTRPEFCPRVAEDRFVALGLTQRGLMCGRPDRIGLHVAQVTEHPPVVLGNILLPTGDSHVVAAAVSTAPAGQHDMVATVGEQLHGRTFTARVSEHPKPGVLALAAIAEHRRLCGLQVWRGGFWHAFLQQQQRRLQRRVRLEASLHGLIEQKAGQGHQAHALVMRHERADHGEVLATW